VKPFRVLQSEHIIIIIIMHPINPPPRIINAIFKLCFNNIFHVRRSTPPPYLTLNMLAPTTVGTRINP